MRPATSSGNLSPPSAAEQAAAPPPKKGERRPTHRFVFRFDEAALAQDETHDGYSALVTTVPQNQSTADQLFTKYKQQNFSEHANSRFKGPWPCIPCSSTLRNGWRPWCS